MNLDRGLLYSLHYREQDIGAHNLFIENVNGFY